MHCFNLCCTISLIGGLSDPFRGRDVVLQFLRRLGAAVFILRFVRGVERGTVVEIVCVSFGGYICGEWGVG